MEEIMRKSNFNIYCCNPFKKEGHKTLKNVRPVTNWMCLAHSDIQSEMKICDGCRKQLSQEKSKMVQADSEENNMPGPSDVGDNFIPMDLSLEYLNKSLSSLDESPILKKRLFMPKYCKNKLDKIKKCLSDKILVKTPENDSDEEKQTESEILAQLKEKFQQVESTSDKITILTLLPKSWSCKKIETQFNVSNRMARKVKKLVKEQGILSSPNPKHGKVLHQSVILKVENFYNSDEISRLMPGKKDFISVKNGDRHREHLQKRLILGNLKEIYELFKSKYSVEKIGFSKFADLRPKNCILAGGSGTHSVCVCTTHQNVKLMISGAFFKNTVLDDGTSLDDYKSCLVKIMCDVPLPKCYLNLCTSCPGTDYLKEQLSEKMEEEMIEQITYKQWVSVDRCSLETFTKGTEDFLGVFLEQLVILKKHSFIDKKQSAHFSYLKENIKENEAVISFDFAENYSFILQDEAQSYHWNNDQVTLFPAAVYFKDSEGLKFKSFVFISENLKHDTIAVHLFKKKLIAYLRSDVIPSLAKVYYFSDGSAAQFKNRKNFSNLCHHNEDFVLNAEWHFYATAHGKGVCDGLGGTVKRLAARASLQRPYEGQIMTPLQLFTWSQSNIPSIHFFYCTNEHCEEYKLLEKCFLETKPIPGTQKLHCFMPVSINCVEAKVYSVCDQTFKYYLTGNGSAMQLAMEAITGFVTCEYDNHWWLSHVLTVNFPSEEVILTFLHPAGPAPSFVFPPRPDTLSVSVKQILTKVEPTTATGRTYTLTKEEMEFANNALKKNIHSK